MSCFLIPSYASGLSDMLPISQTSLLLPVVLGDVYTLYTIKEVYHRRRSRRSHLWARLAACLTFVYSHDRTP